MNIRQALIEQAPSLALQRAAAAEIAQLDAIIAAGRQKPRPYNIAVADWLDTLGDDTAAEAASALREAHRRIEAATAAASQCADHGTLLRVLAGEV